MARFMVQPCWSCRFWWVVHWEVMVTSFWGNGGLDVCWKSEVSIGFGGIITLTILTLQLLYECFHRRGHFFWRKLRRLNQISKKNKNRFFKSTPWGPPYGTSENCSYLGSWWHFHLFVCDSFGQVFGMLFRGFLIWSNPWKWMFGTCFSGGKSRKLRPILVSSRRKSPHFFGEVAKWP